MRKFFTAVILAVFMLSAQIAAAEDYDWSKAPRIRTKFELAQYIENERRKGHTTFHIVLTNGLRFDNNDDFIKLAPAPTLAEKLKFSVNRTRVTYKIVETPGCRVANAYLSSNQQQAWMNLTNEEQTLYNIAVDIVDEANKRSSEIAKARYIHDVVRERVLRHKNENERNKTAIGALIDRYAQCQGYSDAFYMLGRMCGLNVCKIGGYYDGGHHTWNTITYSDGKTYCVDVAFGRFNLTLENMTSKYSCQWEAIPNLQ